jgi:hypothetical protein
VQYHNINFTNFNKLFFAGSKYPFQLVSEEGRIYRLEDSKRHGTGADETARTD